MKRIYYNGRVYTGTLPIQEAFIEENGVFVFCGDSETAFMKRETADELIDLKGRFVCSGFNDSHMHLLSFGQLLHEARLDQHTNSLKELLACMKDFLAEHPVQKEQWIIGRGWNHDYFTDEKRFPNRYDLDQVSTDFPICVVRTCGHCLAVNSKGLELLHITSQTPAVPGGEIGMTDGEPNGLFFENATDLVYQAIPAPNKSELKDMIKNACHMLNSYGITSVQTDDYCVFPTVSWEMVNEVYRELEAEGELTVRVYEQCNFNKLAAFREFVEAGNKTGSGTDYFKIGPLKLLGDGSLGANTAFLSRPYQNNPATCGIPVFTQNELYELIEFAHKNGIQVAAHAIGDQTVDWLLDAFESADSAFPRSDHRHGIVHCQITRPEQLDRMAAMQLHIYAQSIFLDYDIHIVEDHVGKELAASSYNWKTLIKRGGSVSNGSDCPVELPRVLAGIQCAVTRQNLAGDCSPYLPHEAFTVQEALDSFTKEGAKGSFEETKKGTIAPGMFADFVILQSDPFETKPDCLKDIAIDSVYLAGMQVFPR